jgi:hypothetical protein
MTTPIFTGHKAIVQCGKTVVATVDSSTNPEERIAAAAVLTA